MIKHCAWLISDVMNDALKPFGLCYKNYVIMVLIYSNSDNTANPSDLCLGMGETRSNMTRLCDELVDRGWAQRVTNPEDRRRVDLSLTSEGIALLEQVLPMLRTRNKAVYSVFDEQQTQVIEERLIRLMQSLEAHRDV
ncbi:MAG: MarR family transcriptional regulator [Pseudomonadales bacterium]|nr:MarR family transcriptional regulator [Pseudomonadales bacterium]